MSCTPLLALVLPWIVLLGLGPIMSYMVILYGFLWSDDGYLMSCMGLKTGKWESPKICELCTFKAVSIELPMSAVV